MDEHTKEFCHLHPINNMDELELWIITKYIMD